MAKFQYRLNGSGSWIDGDTNVLSSLPNTAASDSVEIRAIGDSASLEAITMRVVSVNAFKSYAIAPHGDFGAIAMELVYGNGSNAGDQNPADSVGAPFGKWRFSGLRTLPSVLSNPETEYTEIIYSGIGSQGVAINVLKSDGGTLYFGDYHAGKYNSVQTGTDPTVSAMVALFEMLEVYESLLPADARNPDGRTAYVNSLIRLNENGSITNTNMVRADFDTLTAALALLMLNTGFTRYSTDLGLSYQECVTTGFYDVTAFNEIWWRNPTTGTIVKAALDLSGTSNHEESNFDVSSSRVKFRARFDTVENPQVPNSDWFGEQTCSVTYSLAASAPDPVPTWVPYTIDFTQATPGNANLPLGFARSGASTAPATLTTSGGGSFAVGSGSGVNRWTVTKPEWVLPPGQYRMEVDYTTFTAASSGGSKVASSVGGSSVDAYSAQQSFNSLAPATHIHTFTVPPGGLGYPALEGTTSVDRGWTVSEIRMTGTPA